MIIALKKLGNYGLFEFEDDKLPSQITTEMVAEGYNPATESDLDAFLLQYSSELSNVPIIAPNSSATHSNGVTGKKCLVDMNGDKKTNYWYTTVLFMDNKYLGVLI